ncbi:hypothetical protein EQ500_14140 [Lactobacillus sp. XV13L]|nr:hypothetical protein [Lactobacillus sp. XV13L]
MALFGVLVMALVVGESRATERTIELKTDRAYAWHVLKKNSLSEVKVHDRIYQPRGEKGVYDATAKKAYRVKN